MAKRADALAAATTAAHVAALANCMLYFGDVMNVDEIIACIAPRAAAA